MTPMTNKIPLLGQSPPPYQSIGIGMLKDSTLMGVFFSAPFSIEVATINMISTTGYITKGKEVVDSSSLGPYEAMYNVVQSISDDHIDDLHLVTSDPYHLPQWLEPSLPTLDYLTQTFPSDESIMEIMSESEPRWEDHHHRSSFLPNATSVGFDLESLIGTDIFTHSQMLVLLQNTKSKGNLCNITKTTPIDISVKPGTIEHVHVGKNCSIEETESYRELLKKF